MLTVCNILLMLATLAVVVMCFPEPSPGAEAKCLEENGILPDDLKATFPSHIMDADSNVDRKFKCYLQCLLKIYGLREENGTFDVAKFAEQSRIPERKEKVTKKCNDCMATFEHEKDQCEYSFKLFSCIIRGMDMIKKEANEKIELQGNEQA